MCFHIGSCTSLFWNVTLTSIRQMSYKMMAIAFFLSLISFPSDFPLWAALCDPLCSWFCLPSIAVIHSGWDINSGCQVVLGSQIFSFTHNSFHHWDSAYLVAIYHMSLICLLYFVGWIWKFISKPAHRESILQWALQICQAEVYGFSQ